MNKFIVLLVLLGMISTGCAPEEEYDKRKTAHLYVDILVAEETYKHNIDSLKIITDSLYSYYQISGEEYKRGIEKFNYSEETWDEFFKLAEEYLDTLKASEERKNIKTDD